MWFSFSLNQFSDFVFGITSYIIHDISEALPALSNSMFCKFLECLKMLLYKDYWFTIHVEKGTNEDLATILQQTILDVQFRLLVNCTFLAFFEHMTLFFFAYRFWQRIKYVSILIWVMKTLKTLIYF